MSKKSFISKIEELILNFTKPDYMDSKEKVEELLSTRQSNENPVKSIFKSIDSNGMQVFTFGDENAKNTIVFIHGGAFIGEINYQHFLYCYLLSRKLDAYVLAPVYPLAPKHSANETFDLITDFYKDLISSRNNIVFYFQTD
jgi:acetyl esterase/lipase